MRDQHLGVDTKSEPVAFDQVGHTETSGRDVLANVAGPQPELVQRLNVHYQDLISLLRSSVAIAFDPQPLNQVKTGHFLVAPRSR